MEYTSGQSTTHSDDLHFTTSVDTSINQNVAVPSQPPTLNQPMTNDAIDGGEKHQQNGGIMEYFKDSSSPFLCILHICFKVAAVFTYLLGKVVEQGSNFITVTVICILLLAADFWVVKNITGRFLVGLRWWAQVEGEDGTETRWIFESAEGNYTPNKFDQTWFWGVLYTTPVIWGAFCFTGLMKLNFGWLITVLFAIALSCANVYGYWQCSKDQKAKFSQMMQQGAEYGAGAALRHTPSLIGRMSTFASRFGGGAQTGSSNQPQENTFV